MTRSSRFGHMVFFSLKENSDDAVQHLISECKQYLSDHPGTAFFDVGKRAIDATREVNDREFDVALHLVFESRQAHDAYQTAARHDEFIARNKDHWAQVRVFDSEL